MRHERNSEVLGATVWDGLEVLGVPTASEDAAFHFENLESHVFLRKALSRGWQLRAFWSVTALSVRRVRCTVNCAIVASSLWAHLKP